MVEKSIFKNIVLFWLCVFSFSPLVHASDTIPELKEQQSKILNYGKKGFELKDYSGDYFMHIEFRGQFRAAFPYDSDPVGFDDYSKESVHMGIRRARMKVGGHAYKSWIKYYIEYDFQASTLLDFRVMYEKNAWLKLKVGQWKVQYNRERIVSSGKQQTVERSILTRAFTVDRQQGMSVFGNLAGQGALNFSYWLGAYTGTGRGTSKNDDNHLMYMSRIQWNPNGKVLAFRGSDIEYHETPRMLLAFAAVTNQSEYTRFSSGGGGQLEGFDDGEAGQYRVNQAMQESAMKFKGFSWQQEFHYKEINNTLDTTTTKMTGYLLQAGYLPHHILEIIPEGMEIFGRHASYYPFTEYKKLKRDEYTMGVNYFLRGHRLKFTGEASYLKSTFSTVQFQEGWRYRFQLEMSF